MLGTISLALTWCWLWRWGCPRLSLQMLVPSANFIYRSSLTALWSFTSGTSLFEEVETGNQKHQLFKKTCFKMPSFHSSTRVPVNKTKIWVHLWPLTLETVKVISYLISYLGWGKNLVSVRLTGLAGMLGLVEGGGEYISMNVLTKIEV